MQPRSDHFHELAHQALQNAFLRRAIRTANSSFQASRETAMAGISDWESLREAGEAIRKQALDHLPEGLELFERAFQSSGGQVHWAEDADAASNIVLDIARRLDVRCVVKSKSMVTEEIALNERLEAAGLRVVETDLGEYIVQLAGESPSHIITPAIHKSREDVASLLHERIDSPPNADIPEMTAAARRVLREEFLGADMGVSGANFIVAETGTVVIVENEGNARMVTTLPRVHVAVVGIEKVVPRIEDLAVLLRLLTRSATGQKVTSYVSFLGGPDAGGDRDGPREVHVVLLDNGRARMWADPRSRAALRCIRCGACLNYCPVYERIGGHAYGWVYPGPIGSILTPHFLGLERAAALPHASSLCGRCGEVCPVKVPLPDLLLDLRWEEARAGLAPRRERLGMAIFRRVASRPLLWRGFVGCVRTGLRWMRRFGLQRTIPGPARVWLRSRDLPIPETPSFRARWRKSRGFRA